MLVPKQSRDQTTGTQPPNGKNNVVRGSGNAVGSSMADAGIDSSGGSAGYVDAGGRVCVRVTKLASLREKHGVFGRDGCPNGVTVDDVGAGHTVRQTYYRLTSSNMQAKQTTRDKRDTLGPDRAVFNSNKQYVT